MKSLRILSKCQYGKERKEKNQQITKLTPKVPSQKSSNTKQRLEVMIENAKDQEGPKKQQKVSTK